MITRLFLIIVLLLSCRSNERDSNFQRKESNISRRLQVDSIKLYKKAVLDFYLNKCDAVYYKRILNNYNSIIDSSQIKYAYTLRVKLDSIIKETTTTTYYFRFADSIDEFNNDHWVGNRYYRSGLKYNNYNKGLIEIIDNEFISSGNVFFDSEFRKYLIDSYKVKLLSSHKNEIDSNIRNYILEIYPQLGELCKLKE